MENLHRSIIMCFDDGERFGAEQQKQKQQQQDDRNRNN